ncbi:MAG: pyridoxamine 5'-phosphate oxidase [Bacteroidota bacterium]
MSERLENYLNQDRKDFQKGELNEMDVPKNPFVLFQSWLERAVESEESEAYAMTLSTCAAEGPRSRVVYLRGFSDERFLFYTNYKSEKAIEIQKDNRVALNFYWPSLERQVRISGIAKPCSEQQSDDYFESRPRMSQIGAWASEQSSILQDRQDLESRVKYFTEKFEGMKIPRPEHWGGFSVKAFEFEFWQGRKSRLHDRLIFNQFADTAWTLQRKSP